MFAVGKKLGMTQMYADDGTAVPVTLLSIEPMTVTQVRTQEKDGYDALQVGYGVGKNIAKPQAGHAKASKATPKKYKEFRTEDAADEVKGMKVGDKLDLTLFGEGDSVAVTGMSKAKGFQGGVKRHGFAGAPASHGHKSVQRKAGSVGQRFPQHTLKGLRMAGRMGGVKATTRGLKVMAIDTDKQTIAVKGAVPGVRGRDIFVKVIRKAK